MEKTPEHVEKSKYMSCSKEESALSIYDNGLSSPDTETHLKLMGQTVDEDETYVKSYYGNQDSYDLAGSFSQELAWGIMTPSSPEDDSAECCSSVCSQPPDFYNTSAQNESKVPMSASAISVENNALKLGPIEVRTGRDVQCDSNFSQYACHDSDLAESCLEYTLGRIDPSLSDDEQGSESLNVCPSDTAPMEQTGIKTPWNMISHVNSVSVENNVLKMDLQRLLSRSVIPESSTDKGKTWSIFLQHPTDTANNTGTNEDGNIAIPSQQPESHNNREPLNSQNNNQADSRMKDKFQTTNQNQKNFKEQLIDLRDVMEKDIHSLKDKIRENEKIYQATAEQLSDCIKIQNVKDTSTNLMGLDCLVEQRASTISLSKKGIQKTNEERNDQGCLEDVSPMVQKEKKGVQCTENLLLHANMKSRGSTKDSQQDQKKSTSQIEVGFGCPSDHQKKTKLLGQPDITLINTCCPCTYFTIVHAMLSSYPELCEKFEHYKYGEYKPYKALLKVHEKFKKKKFSDGIMVWLKHFDRIRISDKKVVNLFTNEANFVYPVFKEAIHLVSDCKCTVPSDCRISREEKILLHDEIPLSEGKADIFKSETYFQRSVDHYFSKKRCSRCNGKITRHFYKDEYPPMLPFNLYFIGKYLDNSSDLPDILRMGSMEYKLGAVSINHCAHFTGKIWSRGNGSWIKYDNSKRAPDDKYSAIVEKYEADQPSSKLSFCYYFLINNDIYSVK